MNKFTDNLRFDTDWEVLYEDFTNIIIDKKHVEYLCKEDLIQIKNSKNNLFIDIGWYPEFDFENGHFTVYLYKGDFHGQLISSFNTRNKKDLIEKINKIFD